MNEEWPLLSRPYTEELRVANSLTQARDLFTSECTFLASLKMCIALAIAAGTFELKQQDSGIVEFLISVLMILVAFAIFFTSLWTYAHSFHGITHQRSRVNNPQSHISSVFMAAFLVLPSTFTSIYDPFDPATPSDVFLGYHSDFCMFIILDNSFIDLVHFCFTNLNHRLQGCSLHVLIS